MIKACRFFMSITYLSYTASIARPYGGGAARLWQGCEGVSGTILQEDRGEIPHGKRKAAHGIVRRRLSIESIRLS